MTERLALDVLRTAPYRTVRPLEPAVRFYVDVLGWDVLEELRDGVGHRFWVSLGAGSARLMLSDRPVHGRERLTWLYVENVDAIYESVVRAGGNVLSEPQDQQHGTREFLIEDPGGATLVIASVLS